MNTQSYLRHRLTDSAHYQLTEHDILSIEKIGINSFILSRLFSKKFRKWKLDENCIARTKLAVETQVTKNQPLKVVFPQGGYKLWRLPSSPTADWAEFFVMAYVLEYLSPIAAAYQPGVEIVFYLHTLLMEIHDNLTTAEIDAYIQSFQKILTNFQQYCPKNISLKILRDADIYSREEYFAALEKGKEKAVVEFSNFPQAKQSDYRRMAELNIKWHGNERWDLLDAAEKEVKIRNAALYEIAATQNLPRVFEIIKTPETVLVFTKPNKDFIGIGSTKTSMAKYWVGYGVLETDGQRYYDRVLTPSQWENCQHIKFETKSVEVIDLPNLQSIKIFPRLHFSKS